MGILNTTPDSFSDGGRFDRLDRALIHADEMIREGASIIDVGGESTRPGAIPITVDEELERVIPVIEAIAARHDVVISIDSTKPAVMQAAVAAGANMINDVKALQTEGALAVAAATETALCLMHMRGEPGTMQLNPHYLNVTREVARFLRSRVDACDDAGIARDRICIDPGFGFGKSVEHNLSLLNSLAELRVDGAAMLVGLSRKRMIESLLGLKTDDRAVASATLALLAVQGGANIVRVHDVRATVHAIRTYEAVALSRTTSG